jgi:hypothetical protein
MERQMNNAERSIGRIIFEIAATPDVRLLMEIV